MNGAATVSTTSPTLLFRPMCVCLCVYCVWKERKNFFSRWPSYIYIYMYMWWVAEYQGSGFRVQGSVDG